MKIGLAVEIEMRLQGGAVLLQEDLQAAGAGFVETGVDDDAGHGGNNPSGGSTMTRLDFRSTVGTTAWVKGDQNGGG